MSPEYGFNTISCTPQIMNALPTNFELCEKCKEVKTQALERTVGDLRFVLCPPCHNKVVIKFHVRLKFIEFQKKFAPDEDEDGIPNVDTIDEKDFVRRLKEEAALFEEVVGYVEDKPVPVNKRKELA